MTAPPPPGPAPPGPLLPAGPPPSRPRPRVAPAPSRPCRPSRGPVGYRVSVTVISVPYHLDEYLPDLDWPLEPDATVTATFPDGDPWERLAALSAEVARAVAAEASRAATAGRGAAGPGRGHPVLLTGDCLASLGIVTGLQQAGAEPPVIWFDAHGDVQTPETTASGYAAQLGDALGLVLATGQVAALAIACTWYPGHAAAQSVTPYLRAVLALCRTAPAEHQPGLTPRRSAVRPGSASSPASPPARTQSCRVGAASGHAAYVPSPVMPLETLDDGGYRFV